MSGLFGKKKPTIKDVLQAAKGGTPAASSAAEPSEVQKDLLDALQKLEQMTAEKKRLLEENDALKGKVHLLQFKVELLVDMVTLANLDCDKLEDELEAVTNG